MLSGARTLARAGRAEGAVFTFQRALNSLASRMGRPEWALLGWARRRLRPRVPRARYRVPDRNGLPGDRVIDQMTALKMRGELLMIQRAARGRRNDGRGAGGANNGEIAQAARDQIAARGTGVRRAGGLEAPQPERAGNARP